MERDLHFLGRTVERLDRADVEFAMGLWQEPDTVRMLLAELRLPAGENRVALGLGVTGDDGPWLVVTREGQFVTCLAEGMSPGACHVVPAHRFASVLARVKRWIAEADAANARVPQDRARAFVRRLLKIGPWMTREDFRVYAAWQPALLGHYVSMYAGQLKLLLESIDALGRPRQRPRKLVEPVLRYHWDAFYSIQAVMPLLALEGRARDVAPLVCGSNGLFLAGSGEFTALLRTAWAAGRFGKPVVAELKQVFRSDGNAVKRFAAFVALLTVAVRHRALRAEVSKVLVVGTDSARLGENDVLSPAWRRRVVEQVLDDTAATRKSFLGIGQTFVAQIGQDRGGALRARWPEAAAVPEDVAAPMLLLANNLVQSNQTSLTAAAFAPAWLGDVEAGELFLAADDAALLREPCTFEDTLGLYERLHAATAAGPEPIRVSKVGRNEACPCGSGNKAKRCCGERAPAPRPVPVEL